MNKMVEKDVEEEDKAKEEGESAGEGSNRSIY